MTLAAGTRLGPYEIVAPVGAGGMGEVYRAHDPRLGRDVALKVLPAVFAADASRRARFEQEARAASALNHPNIVSIYDIGSLDSTLYVAMELVDGKTLRDLIAEGPLAPKALLDLASQMADGLAKAHAAGIVHRDLKPENVIVSAEGHLKILDFGLAKVMGLPTPPVASALSAVATVDRPLTELGAMVGTVAYMSPEQAQAKAVDTRSDVFSLGIVLYEMTTRRRPFGGDNGASILSSILRDTPAPVTALEPAAPAPLDRIIRHCLEKEPDRRYKDASGVRDDLRSLRDDLASNPDRRALQPRMSRGWRIAAFAAMLVVATALGLAWRQRSAREGWVRNQALPQLEGIVDRVQGLEEGRESWDAFVLARRIEAAAPGDPLLERLRPKFTREVTITSDPPGAEVRVWYYDEPDARPILMGTTPLRKVSYPRGFTRIQLTHAGRRPATDVVWNFEIMGDTWNYRLQAPGAAPDDMAYVPPGAFELFLPGLEGLKTERTAAFLMDRHEVSQREYKRFVDAGGYEDPRYWKEPFVDSGHTLPWKAAMARFVDRTGRPGPATWEVGSYPEGGADLPVMGVSWYEAAAYAEWAGKRLPTIFHWNRVAFTVGSSRIVPMANLARKGPVPVGSTKSMNRFGVYDLAGNVREWTWNSAGRGDAHFILGGGWNDPDYAFPDAYAQPPFDRSPTNGFRCIRPLEPDPNAAALRQAIALPFRDFRAEKPASDATFAQFLRLFGYDKTPLDAKIEEETAMPSGLRQRIVFNAAYGGERMTAYLFLPPAGTPPYQVVVLFPGSGSIEARSSAALDLGRVDFLPRSGRAVLFPIYKSTYERGDDLHTDSPSETTLYKDHVVMWAKDLSRSIDYLETRRDVDANRIAYYGLSWGAALGAILPAVEPRIKANVLYVAGLSFQRALPEADQINYVGHVTQPTLMLNGELDFFFPSETSQHPMFDLLGTPPDRKKRLVFPGGHSVPRTEMIKESLAWLDRYLGPVSSSP
jgi:eukaryotic-like serine/threonine-protein kinase